MAVPPQMNLLKDLYCYYKFKLYTICNILCQLKFLSNTNAVGYLNFPGSRNSKTSETYIEQYNVAEVVYHITNVSLRVSAQMWVEAELHIKGNMSLHIYALLILNPCSCNINSFPLSAESRKPSIHQHFRCTRYAKIR